MQRMTQATATVIAKKLFGDKGGFARKAIESFTGPLPYIVGWEDKIYGTHETGYEEAFANAFLNPSSQWWERYE